MTSTHLSNWIRHKEAFFDALIDECDEMMFICDAISGRFLHANNTAITKLGYNLEELLTLRARDIQEVMPDETAWRKHLGIIKQHERIIIEGAHKAKDGTIFPVKVRCRYMDIDEGYIVVHAEDLRTENNQIAALNVQYKNLQQLIDDSEHVAKLAESASKTKDEFLTNMSHEIRTPLNGILGMADIIAHHTDNPEIQEYVEVIKNSGNHLTDLLQDILDLSRIEANKIKLTYSPFSMKKLLIDLEKLMGPMAQQKDLNIEFKHVKTIPNYLIGDPGRIRQILINLINNAIKFTEKGSINVHCQIKHKRSDQVLLEFRIKDTGIGIPKDLQQKVFESFAQVDGSMTRQHGGAGLGLSIASKLVQLLHGSLDMKSDKNGTLFTFVLPFAVAPNQVTENPNKPKDISLLQKSLSCLLAEDDPSNQLVIRKMAEKLGHQIDIVNNGVEALEQLKHTNYDILLLDAQMPVLSGYEVAKSLKSACNTLPILGITAHASTAELSVCFESGMDHVITKPISITRLKQGIEDCLKKNQP